MPRTAIQQHQMKLTPLFQHTSNGARIILFLCIVLLSSVVVMALSWMVASLVFGIPVSDIGLVMGDLQSSTGLNIARFVQIGSQLGLFLIPPLLMAFLVSSGPLKWLGFRRKLPLGQLIPGVMLIFVALPFLHWLSGINDGLNLPDWLSGIEAWMREQEDYAELITNKFLDVQGVSWLLFNLMMVAVIPGIGEEMLFRSVLQPLLSRAFRSVHLGILLTALVFAAMHLQFYGFLPRLVLGMFMGYAFYLSGNIWLPVIMHTVNNGVAVVIHYLHFNGLTTVSVKDAASFSDNYFFVALSVLLSALCLMIMVRSSSATKKEVQPAAEPLYKE